MNINSNIGHTIGRTPLVALKILTADLKANILAKLEFFNPLGSVKDRIGRSMIEAAEITGELEENITASGDTSPPAAIPA